ncbi:MAG: epoxyqueuosine reductase [candidate division NC10 bacterium]|nr:epoxyqueuosine reductase [candidate division NC10 bacterium]
MSERTLQHHVQQLAEGLGADFFGVADLAPAHAAILDQGGPALAGFPRAISIGVALPHAIVDQLPNRAERAVSMLYRQHAYDIVNQRLDHVASRVNALLQGAGYRSLPVPASQTADTTRLRGVFSNKLAGSLAGLGWIGRSCLLVTREAGPRVRWASILTTAPLDPTGRPMEPGCADCRECVDACPVSAFTGRLFSPEEPREMRFDVHKCRAYMDSMEKTRGLSVCGMCLYACPRGKEASARLAP